MKSLMRMVARSPTAVCLANLRRNHKQIKCTKKEVLYETEWTRGSKADNRC